MNFRSVFSFDSVTSVLSSELGPLPATAGLAQIRVFSPDFLGGFFFGDYLGWAQQLNKGVLDPLLTTPL